MKTSFLFRSVLPLTGLLLTSCGTSGQLLPVEFSPGLAYGAVALGAVVSIVARLQKKATAC